MTKAAEPKASKPQRNKDGSPRKRVPPSREIKDPVLRSDAYTANLESRSINAKQRQNRLRELIEPKTEAMVKVMISIAEDVEVHPSIRMECADRVLSRAYGKPKEHVEISDTADAASSQDEVMKLLGNIFEAVGLPPMLEGSQGSSDSEGSPTS